jgi:hypothetical protein
MTSSTRVQTKRSFPLIALVLLIIIVACVLRLGSQIWRFSHGLDWR